jgi:hypothetical protein
MIWLQPIPTSLSRQQIVSLSQSSCMTPVELNDGRGGRAGGGEEAKSYDGEKAWSSIYHSVLSELSNSRGKEEKQMQLPFFGISVIKILNSHYQSALAEHLTAFPLSLLIFRLCVPTPDRVSLPYV